MMNPATISDFRARYPRALTEHEKLRVTVLLDDAWTLLQMAVPGIEARFLSEKHLSRLAAIILCEAVKRIVANPFGHRQHSESIDDYSQSVTVDGANARGKLYFTEDEIKSLEPVETLTSTFSMLPGW